MNPHSQFSTIFGQLDSLFGMSVSTKYLSKFNAEKESKRKVYWDPVENLNVEDINTRCAKVLAQVNFLKDNPKHPNKQRFIWCGIGLVIGLFFLFFSVFGLAVGAVCIPFILVTFYFKNLSRDLLKIQLASKNNWLYDPTPSHHKYQLLKSHYPEIFKKGNRSQRIDDQFWGVNTIRKKDFLFNSGMFYYSVKKGKNSTNYTTHYLFIKLQKELNCEFLLSPEKKSIFNVFRSKEINTESEEFNKLFEFSYNGKKDEKALEIVKSLSPAVQLKLTELTKKKGPFNVLFSKSTILFLFNGALLPNMKTNLFNSVEIKTNDAEKVEKEISLLIDLGASIAKYLN